MRAFTMVLFMGAAIALPISKSDFGADKMMTSSSRSPQILEHRAKDAIASPLNSWSLKSIVKRVTATVLPRSPFSCCHEAADYPSIIKGGVPTYGPIVDNGEDTKTTPPNASFEDTANIKGKSAQTTRKFWRPLQADDNHLGTGNGIAKGSHTSPIQARNASFWGRTDVKDTAKGTKTLRDTPTIQARNGSFWGRAHVKDTPADAEEGTTATPDTQTIQARSPQNPTFWSPAHVDDTPADAEKGPANIVTPPIQARNASFWGRDHVENTPADAEEVATTIQARTPQNPTFWGPAHVDDTPADAEEGSATIVNPPIQARNASFWGRADVENSPADAEEATATTPDTPAIQARSPQEPTFWGPSHVDDTPADGEKGTATNSGTPEIHGRSPQVTPGFWDPAHVDESPSDTEDSVAV
ncbi:MAG: hypothetical protein OHK93_002133 [Ramalina farinacea]|uniref:Uncharacterized protein n=1 Tax=Ramalina farinacea TaxID=258253 RepID=A0AA43QU49_9LECA|nr:hypothetical protein [Ramalina farinacea]